jgi:hypothetical protein
MNVMFHITFPGSVSKDLMRYVGRVTTEPTFRISCDCLELKALDPDRAAPAPCLA